MAPPRWRGRSGADFVGIYQSWGSDGWVDCLERYSYATQPVHFSPAINWRRAKIVSQPSHRSMVSGCPGDVFFLHLINLRAAKEPGPDASPTSLVAPACEVTEVASFVPTAQCDVLHSNKNTFFWGALSFYRSIPYLVIPPSNTYSNTYKGRVEYYSRYCF